MVVLAKNKTIQELLASYGVNIKTVAEAAPFEVHSAKILSELFTYLGMGIILISLLVITITCIKLFFIFIGRNEKLGLSGRKSRDIGVLATSRLYKIQDKIFAFTPQVSLFE